MEAARLILALNCGSSSLKFGAYQETEKDPRLLCEGEAEEIGGPNGRFGLRCAGQPVEEPGTYPDHAAALDHALELLTQRGIGHFSKVGHRIVHGGPKVRKHQMLTPEVLQELRAAIPFAPLHLPASLAVLDAIEKRLPGVPQVICLDTAFHNQMPDVARWVALKEEARRAGVERFGFHGLSLESIVAQLHPVPRHLVVAHLGNGSSITAIRDGQSIDTSMGLTPTGGVMMGTRCGDLDPGVLIFLARHGYSDPSQLEALVNKQSGLLGVSSVSSDVRVLLDGRDKNPTADLALRMFCYQVRKTIASMAAALGGLDLLVFTGGIGEHATTLREEICAGLRWIDAFEIRVLPAEEDLQIARIVLDTN